VRGWRSQPEVDSLGQSGGEWALEGVEVSFDDGPSWRRLPILRVGDRAFGLMLHPRDATYVSLRGSARDVAGHEVEQTILRAYGLTR
jgi:hypothetical protein